jgi:hypothetical protein
MSNAARFNATTDDLKEGATNFREMRAPTFYNR